MGASEKNTSHEPLLESILTSKSMQKASLRDMKMGSFFGVRSLIDFGPVLDPKMRSKMNQKRRSHFRVSSSALEHGQFLIFGIPGQNHANR